MTDQHSPVPVGGPAPGQVPDPDPSDDVPTDVFPAGDSGGWRGSSNPTQRLDTSQVASWPGAEEATSVMEASTPPTTAMGYPDYPGQPTTVVPAQGPVQETQYLGDPWSGRPTPPAASTPAQPAPIQAPAATPAQVAERVVYVDRPVDRIVEKPVPVPAPDSTDSVVGWMGILLLLAVPVVGLFTTLILACGGTSVPSRARFARALLLWNVLIVAGIIAVIATGVVSFSNVTLPSWDSVMEMVRRWWPQG